jgi:hypothetical protein
MTRNEEAFVCRVPWLQEPANSVHVTIIAARSATTHPARALNS